MTQVLDVCDDNHVSDSRAPHSALQAAPVRETASQNVRDTMLAPLMTKVPQAPLRGQ